MQCLTLVDARVDNPEQEQEDQQDQVGHDQTLCLIHGDGIFRGVWCFNCSCSSESLEE